MEENVNIVFHNLELVEIGLNALNKLTITLLVRKTPMKLKSTFFTA